MVEGKLQNVDDNNVYHVYPVNDLKEHDLHTWPLPFDGYSCDCKCKPRIEEVDLSFIVVHNSFDGREGVEWVNEILNNKFL